MKIHAKQQELVDELLAKVKERFPSVEFSHLTSSPENPNAIWVHVHVPDDETALDVGEYAAHIEIGYLVDYSYSISLMPHVIESVV